ncbi:flagellar biosynthetic protein FliO [Clostridium sardiniense]|uniref:Flagellar biosynthetic protein FliO n=1 Tax=Clostridium sardiniense TaxID=29369 RepID=A0ABS7KVL1_CLOSR|nr:flagellar biosynthetic protein FliO [Clostridium sardiniense]MBM7835409.1 flagellar biogenesis protein FliO [Clostridium sardiniense]MBY0754653.1 flagellar biosynthetic protein FliO [Clostridium sardiniense]MDQ0460627.1 flagellar biogenesis protein FliO [Clostridium sardiniense]
MDKTIMQYLINIIVLVPVGVLLIVISIRLSKKSINKVNSGLYVQIIERFNLNKDLSLYFIKTGSTGCVLIASAHNIEKIKELDEEKMNEIMIMKKQKQNSIDLSRISGIDFKDILNKKFIGKKDDGCNK